MVAAQQLNECAGVLAGVQLFAGLDAARLASIAALCQPQAIREGEHVIREGDPADCFFILIEGTVAVHKQLKLPQLKLVQEGDQRILTRLSGADKPVLGETALVGEAQRRSSVVCTSECRLYRVDAAQMRQLIERDPATGCQIYSHLSSLLYQRLEQANMDVVKLSAALVFALEE
jgi:voltage-gated potassium channel